MFLGFARGKVGDVVFSRQGGQQVARARNRSPKNPQTPVQLLQRIVMKTTSLAYSLLQPICNHSFQGRAEGTPCQSRFAQLNVAKFRAQLADIIASGDDTQILYSDEYNFSAKSDSLAALNPYIISEGTLQPLNLAFTAGSYKLIVQQPISEATAATITYQQAVDMLGLQRGDQLTFLWLSANDTGVFGPESEGNVNGFQYARVILEPNDGDMSGLLFADGAINKPNVRNEGDLTLTYVPAAGEVPAHFTATNSSIVETIARLNTCVAMGAIVSRLTGGIWQRSTQSLVVRPSNADVPGHTRESHDDLLLSYAVESFMTVSGSSLYLNQAENF